VTAKPLQQTIDAYRKLWWLKSSKYFKTSQKKNNPQHDTFSRGTGYSAKTV